MTAGLVVEVAGAPGRYRFVHALVRDVLYTGLSMTRLLRLHRAVADALERLHATDPAAPVSELAHHFVTASPAGGVDKAVAWARRAGESAIARLASTRRCWHTRGRSTRSRRAARARTASAASCTWRSPTRTRVPATPRPRVPRATAPRHHRPRARCAGAAGACALASGAWWGVSAPSADVGHGEHARRGARGDAGARFVRSARPASPGSLPACTGRGLRACRDCGGESVAMARRLDDLHLLVRCLNAQHYVLQAPDRLDQRLLVADEMLRTRRRHRRPRHGRLGPALAHDRPPRARRSRRCRPRRSTRVSGWPRRCASQRSAGTPRRSVPYAASWPGYSPRARSGPRRRRPRRARHRRRRRRGVACAARPRALAAGTLRRAGRRGRRRRRTASRSTAAASSSRSSRWAPRPTPGAASTPWGATTSRAFRSTPMAAEPLPPRRRLLPAPRCGARRGALRDAPAVLRGATW